MKPDRMKSFSRIGRQNVGGQSEIWEEIRPWMRCSCIYVERLVPKVERSPGNGECAQLRMSKMALHLPSISK